MRKTVKTNANTPEADVISAPKTWGAEIWSWVKYIGSLVLIFLSLTTFVFGHFKIPSESMQPTLEVGDHIFVSKWAYGYSRHALPFNLHKLVGWEGKLFSRAPKRGDVVVFRSIYEDTILIKRVVGLPGDRLNFFEGRVFLNGKLIDRTEVETLKYRQHPKFEGGRGDIIEATQYTEQFPGEAKPHQIWEDGDNRNLDNAGERIVPEGHVFFIGDNRDHSFDSRAANGARFVPFENLIGRADMMVYSMKRCEQEEGVRCPGSRWFIKL